MKRIILSMGILLLSTMFIAGCTQDSFSNINSQLKKASNNRYSLSYWDFEDKYYTNGNKYIKVPLLPNGLFLYYENNSEFPYLNYIDNRESVKEYKELPISSVNEIFIYHDKLIVKNGSLNTIYFNSKEIIKIVLNANNSKLEPNEKIIQYIKIKPVSWVNNSLSYNLEQYFWGINDYEINKKYKTMGTPRVVGIIRAGLQKVNSSTFAEKKAV